MQAPRSPVPEAPPAADGIVAAVTQRLEALRERPVQEHVVAYDEIHRLLQDALGRLDEG